MPNCRNTKLLQVLSRQARKNRFVNLVLAELSLILSKAKAPQPDHDVHGGTQNSALQLIIVGAARRGPGRRRGPDRARAACVKPRGFEVALRKTWENSGPEVAPVPESNDDTRDF